MKTITEILVDVTTELARATKKFGPFNSAHEGYAVIYEELDELFDDVRANDLAAACTEAIQVAAMAIRFVQDLHPENNSNPFDLKAQK